MNAPRFRTLEPQRRPYEDLGETWLSDRRRLSGAWPGPKASGPPFAVFEAEAWEAMHRAARKDLKSEQIGLLFGAYGTSGSGQTWVTVRRAVHAEAAKGSAVHADLDAAAYQELFASADATGDLVGWWHTHPDLGAFFSGTDRATQARAFRADHQVGVVIDPVREEFAAFAGARSLELPRSPLVVARPAFREVRLPYAAVVIGLPSASADLSEAIRDCLEESRSGIRLVPVRTHEALRRRSPALVLDRAWLARRHPAQAQALRGRWPSAGRQLALELDPREIVGVMLGARLRPISEFLDSEGEASP